MGLILQHIVSLHTVVNDCAQMDLQKKLCKIFLLRQNEMLWWEIKDLILFFCVFQGVAMLIHHLNLTQAFASYLTSFLFDCRKKGRDRPFLSIALYIYLLPPLKLSHKLKQEYFKQLIYMYICEVKKERWDRKRKGDKERDRR